MLTDRDCANICASIYDLSTRQDWDRMWTADIYAGLSGNVLCFRGSVTLEDWMRDLDAVAIDDPLLGGVHAGFLRGLKEFLAQTDSYYNSNTVIVGHSLGAARAALFGALLAATGRPPAAIISFGSPKPGFLKLYRILESIPVMRHYKNRYDPVTDVPMPIYPTLPYLDPPGRIKVDCGVPAVQAMEADPTPWADFNNMLEHVSFRDHHIQLYQAAVPETVVRP